MTRKRIEGIARVCHEANRAYRRMLGEDPGNEWDYASEEIRDSAFNGVLTLLLDPRSTPQEMHESWMKEKLAHGWAYGPEKNEHDRTHPCLVSYEDLPEDQRTKDKLFSAIIRALAQEAA